MALLNNLFTKGTGTINRNPSLRKLNGLTLYFPDFDFKLENRRELVQFVKSTSFVIDSFCVDGNKIYKNYDLNVIFPIKEKKHIGYLSILFTLYMTSSKFYMLAQHYKRYVLPLLLVFISEIVLVLYLITNIVSSRETFDIWTQMILLALPLFFFLLIIVPIGHREREPLP